MNCGNNHLYKLALEMERKEQHQNKVNARLREFRALILNKKLLIQRYGFVSKPEGIFRKRCPKCFNFLSKKKFDCKVGFIGYYIDYYCNECNYEYVIDKTNLPFYG